MSAAPWRRLGALAALLALIAAASLPAQDALAHHEEDPRQHIELSQSEYRVAEGDAVEVTVEIWEPRDAATPFSLSLTAGTATGQGVDFGSAPTSLTIPAGHIRTTVVIPTTADTKTEEEGGERFTVNLSTTSGIPVGTPSTAVVTIEERPKLVISKRNHIVEEDSRCGTDDKLSHVIDTVDKTSTFTYGSTYTTVDFTVKLARAPRDGKTVHVGVWDPTSIQAHPNYSHRYSVTRTNVHPQSLEDGTFHGYLRRIMEGHGYANPSSLTGGMRGKISINEGGQAYQPLNFTASNWQQEQTVRVKVHCDQHSALTQLPLFLTAASIANEDVRRHRISHALIWRNVFASSVGADERNGIESGEQIYYSPWTLDRTSVDVVNVTVVDNTQPSAQSSYDGALEIGLKTGGNYHNGNLAGLAWELKWKRGGSHDAAYAEQHFSGFRVRVQTVDPSGHSVQEFFRPMGGPSYHNPFVGLAEMSGQVEDKVPHTLTYQVSAVPVDLRGNVVSAKQATICKHVKATADWVLYRVDQDSNPTNCGTAPVFAQRSSDTVDSGDAEPIAPTTAVSNVQVAAVDSTSATVSWDAVPDATSYLVEYAGAASDPQNNVGGTAVGHAGTSWTFQHNAAESMTIVVTVTPEYIDGNGDTQQLNSLSGTTTLQVTVAPLAQQQDEEPTLTCDPSTSSEAIAKARAAFAWHSSYGTLTPLFWRILNSLDADNMPAKPSGVTAETVTAAYVQTYSSGRGWGGWAPIVEALEDCEASTTPDTTDTTDTTDPVVPPPPATPEVGITAGPGVIEGGVATFTISANPSPAAAVDVTVSVSASGDYGVTVGQRTVTLPTSGSATLSVATSDDATDEPDGSVTVTVTSGAGYDVSTSNAAATVAVSDDDDPPPPTPEVSISAGAGVTEGASASFTLTASPVPTSPLPVTVNVTQSGDYGVSTGSQTVTIPTSGSYTLTIATSDDSQDESNGSVTVTVSSGTGYDVSPSNVATVAISDDDDPPPPVVNSTPTLSISDASGSEGETITFTVTLSPSSSRYVWVNYYARPAYGDAQSATYADFGSVYGTLTFNPGETSKTISVTLIDDSQPEGDETFVFSLYGAVQAKLGDREAVGTIIDND